MFTLSTSNADLLKKAKNIALNFANNIIDDKTIGLVFLGGIARNYFDQDADIDIAVFENNGNPKVQIDCQVIDGIEVQTFIADYTNESNQKWDMGKRWAYSQHIIHFDKDSLIQDLIKNKVPLQDHERHTMMMSGITLSEWYCNRLVDVWIRRGSLPSAHHMFTEGINQYFQALFALNNELCADFKWRLHCAQCLHTLPHDFQHRITHILEMRDTSIGELERRRKAFLCLWQDTLPMIEAQVNMKFADFKDKV
jgi:hypothetical protein